MDTAEIGKEILRWSEDRPAWQRDALRRLFVAGVVSDADIDEFVSLCKAGHGLAAPSSVHPLTSAHVAFPRGDGDVISLSSITHHQGVNALAAEQTIFFGNALTLVFGQNAAGKSGYTRILKRVCRSRSTEQILGNVLSGKAPGKSAATIRYQVGSNDAFFDWTAAAMPPAELASISVFDSQCAPIYLKDKTDVAFRPFGLDIFDKLAVACGQVRARLEEERSRLNTAARLLPSLPSGTKARALVDSLTALTKPDSVRALATLSDAEQRRLVELRAQRRDLQATDPKKLARELEIKAQRIETLTRHLEGLGSLFGEASLEELRNLQEMMNIARSVLDQLRTTAFTPGLLPGTGGEDWKRMWSASEAFSRAAYPNQEFPATTGAVCPLCQQAISDEAAARMKHFAEYVMSNALQEVDQAVRAFSVAQEPLRTARVNDEDVTLTCAELTADDPVFGETVTTFTTAAEAIQNALKTASGFPEGLVPLDLGTLRTKASDLRSRAATLLKDTPAMSVGDVAQLSEFEARELLKSNEDAVLDEIDRRQRMNAYAQCIEETSTLNITRKNTELTKELVTDSLRQRFSNELMRLEFTHLLVEVQAAGGAKGALFHRLVFTDAPSIPVAQVLSEGEGRTLSLAAFLTELQTARTKSAIIFDDPVSSLDHVWRERIAKRLVTEAKERQVIVFTHDLLFLRYLLNESEREDVDAKHQYIERDGAAGISSPDVPFLAMKIKQRLGALRNRWQAADKAYRTGGAAQFEPLGRELYRMVRQSWEQAVSEVLLNDVVERFRHSIETQKVKPLHDIQKEDCETVEGEMSECSRWLHDEAAADATPFPGPDALKARIDALDAWVKVIRSRRSA